jgi:hypothetical protein
VPIRTASAPAGAEGRRAAGESVSLRGAGKDGAEPGWSESVRPAAAIGAGSEAGGGAGGAGDGPWAASAAGKDAEESPSRRMGGTLKTGMGSGSRGSGGAGA